MWRFITKNSAAMNGGATKTRRSAALKGRAAMSVVILAMGLVVILMMGLVMGLGIGAPVFAQKTGGASEIPIGVVLPITGKEGKPGQYQKEGIELAIKQINDAGGIFVKDKGKKLLIKEIFYDDGSDSAKSASLTERAMSSDNVTAVLGGYSTALGEAESVMPDRYKTPWITTGAGATAIFGRGYQFAFGSLSPVVLIGTT